jgi:cardiolipin synthase
MLTGCGVEDDMECSIRVLIAMISNFRAAAPLRAWARSLPDPYLDMRRRVPVRRSFAVAAAALVLSSCAEVPRVDEEKLLAIGADTQSIQVYGAHGPLTARQSKAVLDRVAAQAPDAGALERHLALEQQVADRPLYAGNTVRVLEDGEQTFPAMFAAIRAAQRYVLLEYYIFEDVQCEGQSLKDLLVGKSREGVHIYVIYDGVGSLASPAQFFEALRAAGVQFVEFNPVNPLKAKSHYAPNSRDHRKLLVADGELAIVGGVNLSSTYENSVTGASTGSASAKQPGPADQQVWHDTDIEIRGPLVRELANLFIEHWHAQQGAALDPQVGAERPAAAGSEVARLIGSNPSELQTRYYITVLSAVRNAESTIWISAAYFVPTHQEQEDLVAAAQRGVDVRLLLPAHSDSAMALDVQRSYYGKLLKAGVKIYELRDGILHSKTIVIDGVWSIVGSSNLDQRSVLFNDEVDVVVLGKSTGRALSEEFSRNLERADRIDLEHWKQRPFSERLRARVWRVWESLL